MFVAPYISVGNHETGFGPRNLHKRQSRSRRAFK
jgi:hypothetical protein